MASFSPKNVRGAVESRRKRRIMPVSCCESLPHGWICGRGALAILLLVFGNTLLAQGQQPKFRVIALAEENSIHRPFVDAARAWLEKEAIAGNFSIDYIHDTEKIDDAFLSRYQLFIQLDYPPYAWTPTAASAFQKCIEEGKEGWIGFHHATLLGEFDGYPMWKWFSDFMEHSLQELHRFVRDSKGQRRRSKAPCDAGPRRFLRNRTRRVVHLRQITAANRACFG